MIHSDIDMYSVYNKNSSKNFILGLINLLFNAI